MNNQISMPLNQLMPGSFPGTGLQVTGLCSDSRKVKAGDLFVALKGHSQTPGTDYAERAVESGAVAVVSDVDVIKSMDLGVSTAFEPELAQQLSFIAGEFYGHPSLQMEVIGITGTNGKTSCCYWLSWMLKELGVSTAQIGTLGAGMTGLVEATGFTTPDAIQVQRLLSDCKRSGAQAVVMEVSSHGLDQGRVGAVQFEAAIFTNLSQDHLDYHKDMADYLNAKLKLFKKSGLKRAIVNLDESASKQIYSVLDSSVESYSYSISDTKADLFFSSIEAAARGYQLEIDGRWGQAALELPVLGGYNLSNLLAVITAVLVRGFDLQDVCKLLARIPSVPGRLQRILVEGQADRLPEVVVDYAHTPDAVRSALLALSPQIKGKLIAVLGCGGNRDQSKRPLMAEAAIACSDYQIFTADNPRDEEVEDILADMQRDLDIEQLAGVDTILDRKAAIDAAVSMAGQEDLVAVLGKGHELYQEIKGRKLPFSDAEICLDALQQKADKGGVAQ